MTNLEFVVDIRPDGELPLLSGAGQLGDISIFMGRPGSGKSLFLRYLFALLAEDRELAFDTSEEILKEGGWASLRVGDGLLECSKSQEDGGLACVLKKYARDEAYLLYEGVLFTLKHRREIPYPKVADALARMLERIAKFKGGRHHIELRGDGRWYERVGGRLVDFSLASSAVVTVGVLERALQLDAWLLLDGTLDGLHPGEVLYLAGLASTATARLVATTHSPWVRRAFACHRGAARAQGMPAGDKLVKTYEFVDGEVREIELASETYGKEFERLYTACV